MSVDHWTSIFEAARLNDYTGVRYFTQIEDVPANSTNADQQTAAHLGAKRGNLDMVKYLVELDPSILTARDVDDNSLLHLAVENGSLRLIKYLIEDCKQYIYQSNNASFGNTPLHIAAKAGHIKVLDYFVRTMKGDVNVRNSLGESPLFMAVDKQNMEVIKHLTDNLKANVTMTDYHGNNILFICAKKGDLAVPKHFFQKKVRFDVNWQNNLGESILYWATKFNHYDFMKYVVGRKNGNPNIRTNNGRTPIHEAAANGDFYSTTYLFRHGANLNMTDEDDKLPLDCASTDEVRDYLKTVRKRSYRPPPRSRRSICERPKYNSTLKQEPTVSYKINSIGNSSAVGDRFVFGDIVIPQMDSFLILVCMSIRYILALNYKRVIHESLRSPWMVVQGRVDQLAVEVINSAADDVSMDS